MRNPERSPRPRVVGPALAILAAVFTAGCLQLDTVIKLNADGSADVTERFSLSRRLLDMAGKGGSGSTLERFLTEEAAQARLALMGEGVRLVHHEVRAGEKGARECVIRYKAADLTRLRYVSPFLASGSLHALTFGLSPYLSYRYTGEWPGALIVSVRHKAYERENDAQEQKPAPQLPQGVSPAELQVYRELVPVFADMLGEVKLKLRLEFYCNIGNTRGLVHRHRSSGVNYVDLINITDQDFDKHGYRMLENEEIMVEVLRWRLSGNSKSKAYGPFLTDHLQGQGSNLTLPLFHQGHGGVARIRPSLPLFKKYFEGKTLDYGKRGGKQPAKFEKIGWRPKKK
jgi:hypothetical protein